ncbi:Glycine oxidase [Stieleria maiorica]|uniref:Glycine oxidase n=1 Tax=Stieleria maiorica TaxID=2795974 RepID=A0A5B9MSM6_9BACT|nr:FAD-dependent oxidoreductase [Stieleria maiorica]QEG02018.1 Glycine oxidase [Stieleria maiorica]
MKSDVVVIGAGAIGLTLAYELAQRGRQVTVVDRDRLVAVETDTCSINTPFRSATSWAAAGILPPADLEHSTDPMDRLRGLSHQLFPTLAARLMVESGIDSQLARCGGWYLSDTVGETASMVGMVSFWRELSIECVERTPAEFAASEPALAEWAEREPAARAWWVPDEYQISPPLFLQALIKACDRLGVTFLDQSRVVDIDDVESKVTVTLERRHGGRQSIEAGQAVVCGGTWSGLMAPRLRLDQSLVPVRGQVLLLKTETPILSSIINFGQRYFVPRRDGAVLVGSCEEEVGFQRGTTPAMLDEFRRFVRRVCPPLASARELSAWSGLRPLTFDGFPICGKLPGSDSIFVATGHFRSGIHLSPGTAICLADLMGGDEPPIDLQPFSVGKQQGTAG